MTEAKTEQVKMEEAEEQRLLDEFQCPDCGEAGLDWRTHDHDCEIANYLQEEEARIRNGEPCEECGTKDAEHHPDCENSLEWYTIHLSDPPAAKPILTVEDIERLLARKVAEQIVTLVEGVYDDQEIARAAKHGAAIEAVAHRLQNPPAGDIY